MHRLDLIRETWLFLMSNKRMWMFPVVMVLILLGALLVFAEGSALAPFIYTVF